MDVSLVQYARDDARDGVGIDYQCDGQRTLPDARFSLEPDDGSEVGLPAFELASVSAPDEVEIRDDPTLEYPVRNIGDASEIFRGVVQERYDEWSDWKTVTADIGPGETKTLSVESTVTDVTTVDYRLDPFDEGRTIRFRAATREPNEWFTIPRGLELRVTDYQTTRKLEYPYSSTTADDGERFVVVNIDVRRPSSDVPEALNAIGASDDRFVLEVAGNEFEQGSSYYQSYEGPVTGPSVSDVTVDVGATATAYTYFAIPATLSVDDATVRWEEDVGDAVAKWQL